METLLNRTALLFFKKMFRHDFRVKSVLLEYIISKVEYPEVSKKDELCLPGFLERIILCPLRTFALAVPSA